MCTKPPAMRAHTAGVTDGNQNLTGRADLYLLLLDEVGEGLSRALPQMIVSKNDKNFALHFVAFIEEKIAEIYLLK